MNWREIVIGIADEDDFGEPLDPPVNSTLGEFVDEMRALGNELPAPKRCECCGRYSEGRAHWFNSVEWDSLIDSIVHALESADYD